MAIDPSYPLLPIINILCATLLLILLIINMIRRAQAFNLAVNILASSLFLTTMFTGIDMIVWAHDGHLNFPFAYCDIVSHVLMFTSVAKPSCTLLITRQLYNIVALTSTSGLSLAQRRRNIIVELGIGVCLPAFVTGVLYYIVQPARFAVYEGLGCFDVIDMSGYALIFVYSWALLLPLYSVVFYCPRIVRSLVRRRRLHVKLFTVEPLTIKPFCPHNGDDSLRLLVLGCFDLLISLPLAALTFGFQISNALALGPAFPFYRGWAPIHEGWAPWVNNFVLGNPFGLLRDYIPIVSSIVTGYALFTLFGCTEQARTMYMRFFRSILGICLRRDPRRRPSAGAMLPPMQFEADILLSPSVSIDLTATITVIPRAATFDFNQCTGIVSMYEGNALAA
ncbi:unnamed protein product [Peniophora sp. CBMAI 1063]|nr:unnamed protein product [Peniophora sp. CBMAI 1063]